MVIVTEEKIRIALARQHLMLDLKTSMFHHSGQLPAGEELEKLAARTLELYFPNAGTREVAELLASI